MSFSKVSLALLAMGGWVFAAPSGHEVTRGSADVQSAGNGALHIHADDQSVIQWQEFSIGKGELVKFIQPHEKASVVNQVVSNRLSEIYGTLEANGHVYLINPAGIVVGKEGVIHAAGFIASTFDFTETKEGMFFKGSSRAKIENYGTIQTSHGDVFLIGYQVLNEGKIGGDEVRVGQGSEILLKPEGKERLFVKLGDKEYDEGVGIENRGTIEALKTELKADGNAFSYAIKNDGLIEGNRLYSEGGEIYLVAEGGRVAQNGTIRSEGGEVALLGHTLVLNDGSHIDVSHDRAPGKVFVGGNGKDETLMIARQAYFSKGAKISADARVKGDGGRVIVYSADYTGYFGEASVRGGIEGGDGGFVEASGRLGYHFSGVADVNAPKGKNGLLYIDPTDININAG
ncbi:MAG: filamentous hemagglutinin N-terminal domain-containing protein, partial [Chlamydiia bacterium]|nr:filamentous hemagglutinin N-terminal domain-containing protein [Chlamydiia bacterium]